MLDQKKMAARYMSARKLFLDTANAKGWRVESHLHPLAGPLNIPLYVDVASNGNPDSKGLIMISSGTHGIEGYLGSGIQSRLLADGVLDPACHLVMVHGVNPYGFAWHRRVNEDNVDLNRNFIDFSAPPATSVTYDQVYDILNPKIWSENQAEIVKVAVADLTSSLGFAETYKAISGGQYVYPEGMQYGGKSPAWSHLKLCEIWRAAMEGKTHAVQIDLHSGLGERGHGLLMTYGEEAQPRIKRARAMWGELLVSPSGAGADVITTGVLGPFLEEQFPDAEVLAVVLEFGTQPADFVSQSMAADNWLHQYGDLDNVQGQTIKQDVLDAFYIDEPEFLECVYQRASQVAGAIRC